MNSKPGFLDPLIAESVIPEWTALLRDLQSTLASCDKNTGQDHGNNSNQGQTQKQGRRHGHKHQGQQDHKTQSRQALIARLRAMGTQLHTALPLVDYARTSVARLIMRQVASETQQIIIREVMSKRKKPMPQGSGTLDSIESLERKGVRLTKPEKAKLDKILSDIGIGDREFALFRTFRESARDTAHPDLEALSHDALSFTALDNLRSDPTIEGYGREVLDTYWRALRYFSGLTAEGNKTRKQAKGKGNANTDAGSASQGKNKKQPVKNSKNGEKIDRFALREKLEELPAPTFPTVVNAVFKLGTSRHHASDRHSVMMHMLPAVPMAPNVPPAPMSTPGAHVDIVTSSLMKTMKNRQKQLLAQQLNKQKQLQQNQKKKQDAQNKLQMQQQAQLQQQNKTKKQKKKNRV